METNFSRAERHALTQPDPWEPDAETCIEVQDFAASMIATQAYGDEMFRICRVCNECDGHTETCFVPRLHVWLNGEA